MKSNSLRLSASEKIGFIGNLATMLGAGIPILEAVESLAEESRDNMKKVTTMLAEDLKAGQHVHVALAKFPKSFDKVSISLIKASEEAGTLETTLKDLRKTLEREVEFSDKIKSALFYPMIVTVVFVLVLLMMLVVVIPRIATVFQRLKVPLPLPTKIMIFVSNLIMSNPWLILGSTIMISLILILIYKRNREIILRPLLSLPFVSPLINKIDVTRFTRSLHLLLSSGLPIAVSLQLAQEVMVKKELASLVSQARALAIEGHPFSKGLKTKNHLFPQITIKLMEVGEKTGTLEKSLQDISEHMEYEVDKSLKKLTAMLEPLMLILVALAVGGMMIAIIGPIYGLISQVGKS